MQAGKPSRTALAAASHRAVHQVLEEGRIFTDPLALPILGAHAETALQAARDRPANARMRFFIAARSRFSEDALAAALQRGVTQLVVLGGGLDTYAYRTSHQALRIFEVDHPDTQAWKQASLAAACIAVPDNLTYAPIDFERGTLADGLAAAGFDSTQQSFFTWLGVTPYLTKEAVWATFGFIARLAGGAHVTFDYGEPTDTLAGEERADLEQSAARAAELGEPWISFFEPEEMRDQLLAVGFADVEDLGRAEIVERFLGIRDSGPRQKGGGHIVRASTFLRAA